MSERTAESLVARMFRWPMLESSGNGGTAKLAASQHRNIAAVAAVAAVVAILAGASPTGALLWDVVLVMIVTAAVVAAGSVAPWWASLFVVGVATMTSGRVVPLVVGVVVSLVGLSMAARRHDSALGNAVIAGVGVNVLFRSDAGSSLGASAVIGVFACLVLIVAGLWVSSRRVRRTALLACGVVAAFVFVALAGVAVGGLGVRDDARTAADAAQAGVDLLSAGEYELAADRFDLAADSFERVDDGIGGGLALGSRGIPIVAQNVRAGSELAASASTTLRSAASALREVDPSSLRVVNGRLDLDAVRATQAPLQRVQAALTELRATTDDVRSVWLLNRLTQELDELEVDFEREQPRLQNAVDAVELAPALLGGDGVRRYLVLFTTPAEARGLGGFIGNYAELVIDDGELRVVDVGRRSDLEEVLARAGASCAECPDEFMNRYGRFGFSSGEGSTVTARAWSNLTMSPHFPDVAVVASTLYPASGGPSIDGVIVMDPYVIQALMRYSGPVDIPELDVTVEPDTAAQYILRDQYEFAVAGANEQRIDALDTLASVVLGRLLSSELPDPPTVADDFAPLIAERRLLMWTDDPDEQVLFERIGLLGSLPAPGADGGFALALTNAGGSKIDTFLERSVDVNVVDGGEQRELTASVSLANTAPTEGLADYVIGNLIDLPRGTSRLFVTLYGPPELESVVVNDVAVAVESRPEAGWTAHSFFVTIPSGRAVSIDARFALEPGPVGDDADPILVEQPLATR